MTFINQKNSLKDNKESSITTFDSDSPAFRLLSLSSLGWIVVLLGMMCASYLGRHFTEVLSFSVADGWCPTNVSVIGQHCFGDFGHPFLKGGELQVYVKDNLVAVNSPLVMLAFEFIRIFDYRIALAIFLITGTLSVMSPIWWATRSWPSNTKIFAYFLIGFGSFGFITVLDRANPIMFFPGLILWFLIAMENDKRNQVIWIVALMSALKFWGPFFAIGIIMNKRWRDLFKCGALTLMLYIFPLLYFPGTLLNKIHITLNGVTSQYYANLFQPYVISISGLIRRISCAINSETTCNTLTNNWGIFGKSFFTPLVALSIAGWAASQFARNPKSSVMKYLPLIALGAIALPTAQMYNSILFIPAAALVLKWHSPFDDDGQTSVPKFLIPALLSGIVPLPIWFFGESLLSSTNGAGSVFRISYWLIPIVWSCLIAETSWITYKSKSVSESQKFRGTKT
jgi:hypothetical protein